MEGTGVTAEDHDAPTSQRQLILVGEGTLESVPLANGARLTVGRDPDCTVTLDHPSISRHHAAFHGGPPVAIEDLGSRNGIRIDGRRLTPRELVALELGVSIQLGPYVAVVMGGARSSISAGPRFDAIPISDPTEAGLPEIARRIARAGISALLLGETGTGKEVLARTLHQLSRRTGQLVAVNCAALSEQLLESELFGHERGAFTGATSAKPGLFEVARGGTVFLDEVGELPPALQAKLLRALDSRETYRLGGTEPIRLDVRFLSATHRDLVADVAAGRFRRDFYFRINGITLTIAPLRARSGGIPALASHLLSEAAQHAGATPPRLTASAIAALVRHDWPGNVRELKTVLERAVVLADGAEIEAAHILLDRMSGEPREPRSEAAGVTKTSLELAASAHRGNVTSIARELGTSQSQVRRLAKRHGVDLASFR